MRQASQQLAETQGLSPKLSSIHFTPIWIQKLVIGYESKIHIPSPHAESMMMKTLYPWRFITHTFHSNVQPMTSYVIITRVSRELITPENSHSHSNMTQRSLLTTWKVIYNNMKGVLQQHRKYLKANRNRRSANIQNRQQTHRNKQNSISETSKKIFSHSDY